MLEWLFKYPLESFRDGQVGLNRSVRIEFVLIAAVVAALWAFWSYRRETRVRSSARRSILAALRTAGALLLVLCLLGPVLRSRKHEDSKITVAVALDVSRSMGLNCGVDTRSRFAAAAQTILGNNGLLARLPKDEFDVRLFAIGNAARPIQPLELGQLIPGDDNTQLAAAIKDISQSSRGVPLDAMVLLTDGVDTTASDPAAMARYAASRGATVHAVGFGPKSAEDDVEIVEVRAPRRVERGSAVDLRAVVRRGRITEPLELKLYQDAVLLKTELVPPSPSGQPVTVHMTFIPDKEGPANLTLEIPPAANERIVENNRRTLQIDVRETRVEVLFVEGSPRHEYAFIRRSMSDSRHFKVVTLLRIGKGQFYQRADDDTMLGEGFPDTPERLGRFKAIILSDVESSFFTKEQLALIGDFVRVRGGGLLMLGGINSFNLGDYGNTPIADLLPVYLTPAQVGPFEDSEYGFQITKDGAKHEILRLLPEPEENLAQWALMPALKGYNPMYQPKPGATVLAATAKPGPAGQPAVLLAVQNVGAGRTAAFAPANSWRWRMLRRSEDDAYKRFWSQLLRWIAVGSKELMTISTDADVASPRQPITITATVLDKTHKAFNEAKVAATIKDPFGNTEEIALPWVLREDGVYQGVYRPAEKGQYEIKTLATFGESKLEGEASFYVAESSAEFSRPSLDADTLTRVAQAGGGTVDLDGKADAAIAKILAAAHGKQKLLDIVEERDLRDAPLLLLAIAGCWFAEWVLRRRSGLA